MYQFRLIFRRFRKGITLRSINILGLSLIFACFLISATYIVRELSFDRFHTKADRILRISIDLHIEGQENVTGFGARVYDAGMDKLLMQIPEIEKVISLMKINTAVLEHQGEKTSVSDVYYASPGFLDVFDFSLAEGDRNTALQEPGSVLVSRKLARQLFGNEEAIHKTIRVSGRRVVEQDLTVTGILDELPENSHFHTDMIVCKPEDMASLAYVYLLTKDGVSASEIKDKVNKQFEQSSPAGTRVETRLMPLTDIHLYSHESGEMQPNGDIRYVYLIVSSNLLLFIIVLFNLWLNSKVIFLNNLKYYQLLKLNGASSAVVFKEEGWLSVILCFISMLFGLLLAYYFAPAFDLSLGAFLTTGVFAILSLLFFILVVSISVAPVVLRFASQWFSSTRLSLIPRKMAFSNIRSMLVVQYAIVVIVLILTFGISRQIELIKKMQPGAAEERILVMDEQPQAVIERFEILKEELLKKPEISGVTGAMSLPGGTMKDAVSLRRNQSSEEIAVTALVTDPDFFSFFNLKTIAGELPHDYPYNFQGENESMMKYFATGEVLPETDQYVINRSALKLLGYTTPEEAIGQPWKLIHSTLGFIPGGKICAVVDDFAYASLQEKITPTLVMCRKAFLHCFMVRLDEVTGAKALTAFNEVWHQVNPEYPANYTMLQDVYGQIYRNEYGAEKLLGYFSFLCLLIANIGLAVFMAFMIRLRMKEVGVRKVNGATVFEVIRLLSWDFVKWIGIAFILAMPVAYYLIYAWLEGFNYKITINGWLFAQAGVMTLGVALLTVSWLTWKAATANPVRSLKSE